MRCRCIALLAVAACLWHVPTRAQAEETKAAALPPDAGQPLPPGALARLGTDRFRTLPVAMLTLLAPDGSRAAVVLPSGEIDLFEVATWKRLRRFGTQETRTNGEGGGGAFSADGKELVLVGNDVACIWATDTGRLVRRLEMRKEEKHEPRGSVVAAQAPVLVMVYEHFDEDSPIARLKCVVYDYAKGVERLKLDCRAQSRPGQTLPLALTPDGRWLAMALVRQTPVLPNGGSEEESLVQLWDLEAGKECGQIALDFYPTALTFSRDARRLVASVGHATHQVFSMPDGKLVQHIRGRRSRQHLVRITPDGKALLSADPDGNINEWDLATGACSHTYPAPDPCQVVGLAWHDGKVVALGLRHLAVVAWELRTGTVLSPQGGHGYEVQDLLFTSPKALLSVDGDGELIRWDVPTAKPLRARSLDGRTAAEQFPLSNHSGRGFVAQLSPRADFLAETDQEWNLRVHDLSARKVLYEEEGASTGPRHLAFFDAGRQLAGVLGKRLYLWEVRTGRNLAIMPLPLAKREQVTAFAAAPDGKTFAFSTRLGAEECRLVIWRPETPAKVRTYDVGASCLAFSPDGRWLAAGVEAASVEVARCLLVRMDQATGDVLLDFRYESQGLSELRFSPDGRVLVAAASRVNTHRSSRLLVLEMASLKVRFELDGHPLGSINRLAFSADSALLASGSDDTSILLWHAGVRPASPTAPQQRLLPGELERLWEVLADGSAADAFQAQRRLAAAPDDAVPFLSTRVAPAPAPTTGGRTIAAWLLDLGHESYAVRARASQVLESIGPLATPALQQSLRQKPRFEARRRLEELLDKVSRRVLAPQELAQVRALEVLEAAGTPEAVVHLRRLAAGHPHALLTQEAEAAVRRGERTDP